MYTLFPLSLPIQKILFVVVCCCCFQLFMPSFRRQGCAYKCSGRIPRTRLWYGKLGKTRAAIKTEEQGRRQFTMNHWTDNNHIRAWQIISRSALSMKVIDGQSLPNLNWQQWWEWKLPLRLGDCRRTKRHNVAYGAKQLVHLSV